MSQRVKSLSLDHILILHSIDGLSFKTNMVVAWPGHSSSALLNVLHINVLAVLACHVMPFFLAV